MYFNNAVIQRSSDQDFRFIAHHESPGGRAVTKAYRCPAGVITIGHGFTMGSRIFANFWKAKYGRALRMGDTITQDEADTLLRSLIDQEYGAAVAEKIRPLRQQVFGGAASMTFNCGLGALGWRWAAALREGRLAEGAALMRKTATTANGRKLAGLVRRRKEEGDLVEFGQYPNGGVPTVLDDVRWYQEQLNRLGYTVQVDGLRGPITVAAVRAFQREHDLVVDGIVGPATRAALIRAADAKKGNQATAGGGAVGGAASGAEGAIDATDAEALVAAAPELVVQTVLVALAVAGLVYGAFWLYRNRGRLTGRRVPT